MAAFAALVLASCDADDFEAPPEPDLYKTPYDFAVPNLNDGGTDQGMPDLKMPADLKQSSDDLTAVDSG
jgi:hypothetical protein